MRHVAFRRRDDDGKIVLRKKASARPVSPREEHRRRWARYGLAPHLEEQLWAWEREWAGKRAERATRSPRPARQRRRQKG